MCVRVTLSAIVAAVIVYSAHLVSASVHYGPASARPTAPTTDVDLSDSSENSCAAFSYSSSGAKVTKVRLDRALPSGTSRVNVTGYNLARTPNSSALYVMPITAADSDRWHGLFARCRLVHADPDTASPQRCSFDCDCPDGGCTQIQLSHLGGTATAGWKLCLVEPVFDLTNLPGVNCTASSVFNDNYLCNNALDDYIVYTEWAGHAEVEGIWIRINFPITVVIRTISLWPRCRMRDQFRTIHVSTAMSDPINYIRTCNGHFNERQYYCGGVIQEDYPISVQPTDYVKITGYDACDNQSGNAGFRKIVVKGYQL